MKIDKSAFYEELRTRLKGLTTSQVDGFEAVLDGADGAPLSHQAYMLATAFWETNKTMQPVIEAYWLSEAWRKKNLRYYPWYGRGYVQLTWEANYRKADEELGLHGELLAKPENVCKPHIAAEIMRRGMDEGWFTGVKLSSCLPSKGVATRKQYMKARTIINGWDKADEIEDYAQIFERALRVGGIL